MLKLVRYFLIFFSLDLLLFSIFFVNFTDFSDEKNEFEIQPELRILPNVTQNLYCEKHTEWEKITEYSYFKKDAIFYFHDNQLLRFYGVGKDNRFLNRFLNYDISIIGTFHGEEILNKKLKKVNKTLLNFCVSKNCIQSYNAIILEKNIQIDEFLSEKLDNQNKKYLKLKIQIQPFNRYLKEQPPIASEYLDVKIKIARKNEDKKDNMICSKFYEFDEDGSINQFESWIKLNQKIGYTKIVVYDNSIITSSKFESLFDKYKKVLTVRKIKCFPNFFENREFMPHLRKASELDSKDPNKNIMHIFQLVLYNECFYDYNNKFKLISVLDSNDMLMPNLLGKDDTLKDVSKDPIEILNTLECPREEKLTDIHLMAKKLNNEFNIEQGRIKNIYFKRSYSVSNDLIENIFESINNYLRAKQSFEDFDDTININSHVDNQFKFSISQKNQYEYTVLLNGFYQETLKPFLKSNNNKLSDDYQSLFYIYSDRTSFGKTFYFTNQTDQFINNGPPTLDDINSKRFIIAPFHKGHISEVGKQISFEKKIPIDLLQFDFNYFSCYFKKNLSKK